MSASGDFGPAPPGVNLAKNQNGQIFGAVITLMVIGTIAVIMRFVARSTSNSVSLASDDYVIVAALVGYIFIKYKFILIIAQLFAYGTGICSLSS